MGLISPDLFSTTEVARLLGVSRVAIFKKIKSGEIKAKKVGRNYVIEKNDIAEVLGTVLGSSKKKDIDLSVKRAVKEYGEALKLLGKT